MHVQDLPFHKEIRFLNSLKLEQFLLLSGSEFHKTGAVILFVCFILCFALLCFYVSLHYVLPALQFNCVCLIFMNMYVLLVSVCKCIVYVFMFIEYLHRLLLTANFLSYVMESVKKSAFIGFAY
jgi:hypothetical protein